MDRWMNRWTDAWIDAQRGDWIDEILANKKEWF